MGIADGTSTSSLMILRVLIMEKGSMPTAFEGDLLTECSVDRFRNYGGTTDQSRRTAVEPPATIVPWLVAQRSPLRSSTTTSTNFIRRPPPSGSARKVIGASA